MGHLHDHTGWYITLLYLDLNSLNSSFASDGALLQEVTKNSTRTLASSRSSTFSQFSVEQKRDLKKKREAKLQAMALTAFNPQVRPWTLSRNS